MQLFPDKHIGMVGAGSNDISNDITLTTFKSLKNCAIEKCQLLLVDEIQAAASDGFQATLSQMDPIRRFGYSATIDQLFSGTDKVIKGIFGENLIEFSYEEAEKAGGVVPCTVYMVRMPQSVILNKYKSHDARMHNGIDRCERRNELIGKICSSIPDDGQTIIFVDHVIDHLIPLMKYMPQGTQYLHRDSNKKKAGAYALSPKQQDKIIESFSNGEFTQLIATDAFRAGVDIPNCRRVIQAAGGSSKVEVLQEAYRGSRILPEELRQKLGATPKTHFTLVDILDTHDPALESMSRKRMGYYQEEGWEIIEVDDPSQIDWNHYASK